MTGYVFESNRDEQELERLRLIEEALDPTTRMHLQRTGIQAGWRCLELGAGAGSIMQWLGSFVGDRGSVVGVDRNTSHIHGLSGPRSHIVSGDFLDVTLKADFDLAHCRYVLIHNQASQALLHRLGRLLNRNGYLVVEEPDFTSAKLLDRGSDGSQQRVNNAICRMFEARHLDPAYGLRLPEIVAAEGLQIVEVDAHVHLACGGSSLARMMAASTRALADEYVGTGEATRADIERYVRNAADDQFWTVYYSTVCVIARKSL
jgi:SAM-dependent methyltransferase